MGTPPWVRSTEPGPELGHELGPEAEVDTTADEEPAPGGREVSRSGNEAAETVDLGEDDVADEPRGRRASPLVTAAAFGGLVACVVLGFALGGGFTGAAAADPTGTAASAKNSASATSCHEEVGAGYYRGNGPGTPETPVGVVAAFEHAYYVARDAEAAVALTTPESGISATHLHLDGIGQLPAGTRHCVTARADSATTLAVELVEQRPGLPDVVIEQRVTVVRLASGGFRIAAIEHPQAR